MNKAVDQGKLSDTVSILYIEDDTASRTLLRRAFEHRKDMQLHLAKNLKEADGLLALKPDLILLDIHLPDGNGLDFLSTIRSRPETSDTPVIAVSASAMKTEVVEGLAAGFSDYLTKPLQLTHLFEVIESLV